LKPLSRVYAVPCLLVLAGFVFTAAGCGTARKLDSIRLTEPTTTTIPSAEAGALIRCVPGAATSPATRSFILTETVPDADHLGFGIWHVPLAVQGKRSPGGPWVISCKHWDGTR